jgi:hypothetical protein
VLGEDIFLAGGSIFNVKLEGAPANEEGNYESGFYKVDLAGGELIRVGGDFPANLTTLNMKLAASKDKIYMFMPIEIPEEAPVEAGGGAQETTLEKETHRTVSDGAFLRVTYDASHNEMTMQDLTDTFNEVLGEDLRTEYEYKSGGDTPGEHFAIAGLDDGVAIIGSSVSGEDVHILYDTEDKASLYDRASSYHKAFDPIATFSGGTLYVIGYNPTEPDVMYFRSDTVKPQTEADGSGAGQGDSDGTNFQKYIGWGTIGLFALAVIVLSLTRKKKKEEE